MEGDGGVGVGAEGVHLNAGVTRHRTPEDSNPPDAICSAESQGYLTVTRNHNRSSPTIDLLHEFYVATLLAYLNESRAP